MKHVDRLFRGWQWAGPSAPLSIAAYITWAAVASRPLLDVVHGRLAWNWATAAGTVGLIAVPALFSIANLRRGVAAPNARTHVLILLEAPAAVAACWGLYDTELAALLVIVAAQFTAVYRPRTAFVLLLATDMTLLGLLSSHLNLATAGLTLLAYGGFQTFAALTMAYAKRAEQARDTVLRTNAELLATRQLLLESARSEERLRLSRELHDVAGHKLTALKLQLRLCARDAVPPADPFIQECMRLADELLADVRGVVSALRAADGIDLHQSLTALIPALPRPQVRLELADDARVPGVEQAQTLLRCAQEGLTNALRHSGAENIVMRLRRSHAGVTLSIEDDGALQAPPLWGNGLMGMEERLKRLGGTLEVATVSGRGLRVCAWLPQPDVSETNA